ncbi:hypothetical protein [Pendulispora albinea]|uniref:PEGA domain-containing protein n=1 Tax=Pendulispora albinea TaxID=2741071 RepID=A0ABZ2LQG4_9BACT
MSAARIALISSIGLAAITGTTAARADDRTAEALFRAAKQAVQAGDYKTACEKFEQSQQLEPAPGTLLNLADCEEHLGRLGLASQHFRLAALHFRAGDSRITYAKQRATAAESRMPRLAIRIAMSSSSTSSGRGQADKTTVLRDGVELDPAALGQPLRVDPGEHVVIARTAGMSDATYTITLSPGETKELLLQPSDTPARAAAPAVSSSSSFSSSSSEAATREPKPVPPSASASASIDLRAENRASGTPVRTAEAQAGPSRTLGWIALGVGGAGIAVGTIFGLRALSEKSTIDSHCNAMCDREGYDAQSSYKDATVLSTLGFGAALAGIGVGTYFLVARPFDKRVTVTTQTGHGLGLRMTAEF